ncbi:hypothetical protein A3Q56_05479 [Intoshia linei]|uniref:Biogenesis of lysosome-related organelles complex 1 subunit 2 n=1 Tax=Intoshia linei TaxID=1819745 RepID=A0A177AXQ3_9BILA|nr:hypothetical protein A3Q56_05479 [Intoshia linei]
MSSNIENLSKKAKKALCDYTFSELNAVKDELTTIDSMNVIINGEYSSMNKNILRNCEMWHKFKNNKDYLITEVDTQLEKIGKNIDSMENEIIKMDDNIKKIEKQVGIYP